MTAKESAAVEFRHELVADGQYLCVLPVPRLTLSAKTPRISGCVFYPAGTLDTDDLNVVSDSTREWHEAVRTGEASLGWMKSTITGVGISDFDEIALVAFALQFDWDNFLDGDYKGHMELLRQASEKAEAALDLIRFSRCHLDRPDTLPGKAGALGHGSPFSAGLLYTQSDHESYIVAGQILTHTITAGLGLELDGALVFPRIESGEVGHVARRGLALLTQAMESNSQSLKFVQCMSLLDFLADPDQAKAFKKLKPSIAAHVAKAKAQYRPLMERLRELIRIRTEIVHLGQRLEGIIVAAASRDALFRELHGYIGKMLNDMLRNSNLSWSEFVVLRERLHSSLA